MRNTVNRDIRVLMALPGLHRVSRGAEMALETVASHLARTDGFQLTVIGSGPARPDSPYKYQRARCISREHFEHWPSVPYLRGQYAYEELTFAPGLWSSYSPDQFDATITCSYPYTSWTLRHGRSHGSPRHIFVTQNGDWMARGINWEFKHFACDGLICVNPEYYQRHAGRWKCALIPNGVDTTAFHPGSRDRARFGLPASAPVVLMVSALISSKRVLEGIRAVAKLNNVHLAIAGDGELRCAVGELGRSLLHDRFHPFNCPKDAMPDLYRCADVVLHMSMDEPFGNVYVEALATGLPVIAHDMPSTRWILGDAGYLLDTQDEAKVTETLRQMLAIPSDPERIAQRVSVANKFDWSGIAAQYGEFIRDICREDLQ
jgi:glycosyltransferase involved in cell wall biosynthesis